MPTNNPHKTLLDAGKNDLLDRKCDHPKTKHLTEGQLSAMAYTYYSVSHQAREQVKFETADFCQHAAQPFTQPTVLFCKHFLHQLPADQQAQTLQNLYNNLPKGSMIILGDDEGRSPTAQKLAQLKFQTLQNNTLPPGIVWIKP